MACGWNATSIWWSNIYTLFLPPKYLCLYSDSDNYETCEEEVICDNSPSLIDYKIDWSQETSLHNWYERFDLQCQSKFVNMALFSYYATQPIILLWLPRLTDKIGRKVAVQFGVVISAILYTVLMLTSNKFVLFATIAMQGALVPLYFNVAFIYLLELMPIKSQSGVSSV